mgnify:CR=1 FL=1
MSARCAGRISILSIAFYPFAIQSHESPATAALGLLLTPRKPKRACGRFRCAPRCMHIFANCVRPMPRQNFVLTGTNRFLSPRAAAYRFSALLRRCGLPPLHYHVLRHTFASRCVESGIDVKSLSELLGHANAAVTLNIYVHSSLEQKRAQLEHLSAFLRM